MIKKSWAASKGMTEKDKAAMLGRSPERSRYEKAYINTFGGTIGMQKFLMVENGGDTERAIATLQLLNAIK